MAKIEEIKSLIVADILLGLGTYIAYTFVNREVGLVGFAVFVLAVLKTIKRATEQF
ncbi:MAG: hypothetical protein KKD39_00520 [Candidatus Altiarchaeota archaeon]|nr:hypothetical protein [Candidatus Altiarchaeota archaeon]